MKNEIERGLFVILALVAIVPSVQAKRGAASALAASDARLSFTLAK